MLSNHRGEGREPGDVGGDAALDPAQLRAKSLQLREPCRRRCISLVCKIVGLPCEAVNQRDRMPKSGGQKEGCDREIFVGAYPHLLLCNINFLSDSCTTTFTQVASFRRARDYITMRKSRKWRNW